MRGTKRHDFGVSLSHRVTLFRVNPKRSHQLRYVLRNRTTSETYLVVLFTLYLKEDVNEDGTLKPSARPHKVEHHVAGETSDAADDHEDHKVLEEASKKFKEMGVDKHDGPETSADDVD